jgi:hypothetical protein
MIVEDGHDLEFYCMGPLVEPEHQPFALAVFFLRCMQKFQTRMCINNFLINDLLEHMWTHHGNQYYHCSNEKGLYFFRRSRAM